ASHNTELTLLLASARRDARELAGRAELAELALHLAREQHADRIDTDGAERVEQLARVADRHVAFFDAIEEQLDQLADRAAEVLAQDAGCLRGSLEIDAVRLELHRDRQQGRAGEQETV